MEQFLLLLTILTVLLRRRQLNKKKRKRRWWIRPVWRNRRELSHYYQLFKILATEDDELLFRCIRMTMKQFHELLELLRVRLQKRSIRRPILPEHRLLVTL